MFFGPHEWETRVFFIEFPKPPPVSLPAKSDGNKPQNTHKKASEKEVKSIEW